MIQVEFILKLKMKQFLFLSLLVCFAAFANCDYFSSSRLHFNMHKDFYAICPEDQFFCNGLQVNSFLKVHGELGLDPIGDYALNDEVDYHRMFNKIEADQVDEIRRAYHQSLVELYGKDYLNNPRLWFVMYERLSALQANLTSFQEKGKNLFLSYSILGMQNKVMEKAKNLSLVLNSLKSDTPTLEKSYLKMFDDHYITKYKFWENITVAFSNVMAADIVKKLVYKFDRFEPTKGSKIINDWKKDSGNLYFDIHIPFEERRSEYINKTIPCVQAKELPVFFQLKGKIGL